MDLARSARACEYKVQLFREGRSQFLGTRRRYRLRRATRRANAAHVVAVLHRHVAMLQILPESGAIRRMRRVLHVLAPRAPGAKTLVSNAMGLRCKSTKGLC